MTTHRNPRNRRYWTKIATVFAAVIALLATVPLAQAGDATDLDDTVLATKIHSALLTEFGVDVLNVDVEVDDGEVWLTGNVNDETTRDLAEDVVESIDGVSSVHTTLELKSEADDSDTMETLQKKANNALLEAKVRLAIIGEIGASALDLGVEASGGEVVLTGTLPNEGERDAAETAAEAVDGVSNVIDRIDIDSA